MTYILDCLYLLAAACLLPFWLLRLPRAPRYRAGVIQRLGFSPRLPGGRPRLWVHCASVGEASIPGPLLAEIAKRHPDWEVVFSTNTNTGAARLRELHPDATVFYMPLDFSPCVRESLSRVQPDAVVLVELEVWPNFAEACRAQGIPIGIINGRINPGSRRLLRLLSRLFAHMWDPVLACCARSPDDAEGFAAAGLPADRITDCGMLKCDGLATEPDAARQERLRRLFALRPDAPVLTAGSTHPGEEAILARAYHELRRRHRTVRMIVAPRHIERSREAAAALRGRGFPIALKTDLDSGAATASGDEVIVVDTIGDLRACYGLATVAFVGRSLIAPGGGQNVMEPAAFARPILTGPHTRNFGPEMNLLKKVGAAVVVHNRSELIKQADRLLSDPAACRRMGQAGRRIVLRSQGAAARTAQRLEPLFSAIP